MRIKELSALTGVRKETIHYYTRENLLPRVKKTNFNQAEYGQAHIDRLILIKNLQKNLFMPLSSIKKLIKNYEDKGFKPDAILKKKIEYINPMSQLLEEELRGEDSFLRMIGLSCDRLVDFEHYNIITPKIEAGEKVYSYEDLIIGRILGDMRKSGFSAEKGFRKDLLNDIKQMLQKIIDMCMDEVVFNTSTIKDDPDMIKNRCNAYMDLIVVFLNHLFVKLSKSELALRLEE
jgi:DNA-binding transcriptional MerR regulator